MDLKLSKLGFSKKNYERFATSFNKPHGMLLVTGPTGSGKSTALYATLAEIRTAPTKAAVASYVDTLAKVDGIGNPFPTEATIGGHGHLHHRHRAALPGQQQERAGGADPSPAQHGVPAPGPGAALRRRDRAGAPRRQEQARRVRQHQRPQRRPGVRAVAAVRRRQDAAPAGLATDPETAEPLDGSPTIPFNQRWSINDSSNFQSTAVNGSSLGSFCFHAKAGNTPSSFVELNSCAGAADNTRTFAPEASVGVGAAGPPAQLVNFKQFGRCVDVTNFDTTLGYLIVWPCKQAPNPLNVGWNQRYTVPTTGTGLGNITGQISTYDSTRTYKTYCLTTAEPGAASYFVTVKVCPLTTDKTTLWTVSYQEKTYGAGYVIEDYHGSCLSPTNLDDKSLPAGDVFKGSTTVSKLIVAPCDGSKLQKWNAPPNIEDPSPLKNVGEK
jgi:hypothetical protein